MKTQLRHVVLIVSLSSLIAMPAYAWNAPGHMISAALAYRELKSTHPDKANQWVAILKKHEHFTPHWKPILDKLPADQRDEALFMLAARWPDDVRDPPLKATFHRRVWHFADHPLKFPGAPSNIPVRADGIVLPPPQADDVDEGFPHLLLALSHNLGILSSDADERKKAVALCWVLHLVGDMHQPLHMVSRYSDKFKDGDAGGNNTFVKIPPSNATQKFHSYWDGLIMARGDDDNLLTNAPQHLAENIAAAADRADDLFGRDDLDRDQFPQLATTKLEDWAEESVKIARARAYLGGKVNGSPKQSSPFVISKEVEKNFDKKTHAIAERQLALSSHRMADLLNR